MSLRDVQTLIRQYALIAGMLAVTWFWSSTMETVVRERILHAHEGGQTLFVLFSIVIIFAMGFLITELAKPTVIPSFVLAIFFGMTARGVLAQLVASPASLSTLITIGAVLILFGGGLDTPFQKFRDLVGPILSLAILGTFLQAILFSLLLISLSGWMGMTLPVAAAVILGAALASTDPAAIIPSFQSLLFIRPRVKHIAVSESAINDVMGAVLTTVFLTLFAKGNAPLSVFGAYRELLHWDNVRSIFAVVTVGCGVGLVGYGILQLWSRWKARVQTEDGGDAALFLAVPLFAYTTSQILGGSGYLAVFISGLMFHIRSHFRHVEHYFNHTIEGFMKPMIFMLLGAMVDPAALWEVAPMGILSGLLFMVVLRPLTVLVSLLPFCCGKNAFDARELVFLSFVRETGVIPAVLLITASLAGIPQAHTVMAVGLWVILSTLIIEPPLTPFMARKLQLASHRSTLPARRHHGPVAVLCSRGYSFPERMQAVVQWAQKHAVDNIALLHCPEEKYSEEFVADVRNRAEELFRDINRKLVAEGKRDITFEFLCGPGLLQDNIEKLIAEGDVSIIFVGSRMLDYRMEDVKRLQVPFFFL